MSIVPQGSRREIAERTAGVGGQVAKGHHATEAALGAGQKQKVV